MAYRCADQRLDLVSKNLLRSGLRRRGSTTQCVAVYTIYAFEALPVAGFLGASGIRFHGAAGEL